MLSVCFVPKYGQKTQVWTKAKYVKNFDTPAYKNYIFLFLLFFVVWKPHQIIDRVENQFKKLFLLLNFILQCIVSM